MIFIRESRPLELNMNLLQNPNPFPMQHPFYSQISNKAVFPDYIAPEDTKRGEKLICSNTKSITAETKAAPEPMIVISKQAGFPYRHELRLEQMPSQKQGAWWIDNEQYQVIYIYLCTIVFVDTIDYLSLKESKTRSYTKFLSNTTKSIYTEFKIKKF